MAEKRRVFITVRSTSDMTIFDWERHIEEVQAALVGTVIGHDWDQMHVYGPNTGGFSPPAMCVEVVMNLREIGNFMERLAAAAPWMRVPVSVNIAGNVDTLEVSDGDPVQPTAE